MSYQVLARKWRPRNFAELVGQDHVARALSNALEQDRVHHAFLFAGTRGVGKTTIARILAKCLNCEGGMTATPCGECSACREIDEGRFVDLIEVDAASRAKVEETRELLDNVQFAPARGRFKVYLIDEVHMFSKHSFNALLKTLEEPPPHVKFLLATTDPQKLPVTVLSRCLQFNLRRIPVGEIETYLAALLEREQVAAEAPAIRLVAEAADGSMRDGLSLLDQAIAYGAGAVAEADVRAMLGTVEKGRVQRLLEALARQDAPAVIGAIDEMAALAADFGEVLAEVVNRLQRVAVVQLVPDVVDDGSDAASGLALLAGAMTPEAVQLYYQIGLMGRRDLPFCPDPRAGVEMTMLRMLAFAPEPVVPPEPRGDPGPEPVAASGSRGDPGPEPAAASGSRGDPGPESAAASGSRGDPGLEPVAPSGPRGDPAPAARSAPAHREAAARPGGTPAPAGGASPAAAGEGAAIDPATWPAVVAALPLAGVARELSLNTAFIGLEGGVVRLRLSPAHRPLLRDSTRDKLAGAVSEYLGRPVQIRIEIGALAEESPAQIRDRDAEARQQAARRALENDPVVRAIQDRFDAKIDEGSVRPVDGE